MAENQSFELNSIAEREFRFYNKGGNLVVIRLRMLTGVNGLSGRMSRSPGKR